MEPLILNAKTGRCEVTIGASSELIGRYIKGQKVVVITDSTIRKYHEDKFPKAEIIEITAGESSKTFDSIRILYEKFLELEVDRSSLIIGIGGGIICDIAGFVATTYMRGIHLGFIPTTLLAQVDASIGGKNGINLKGYKNLIGTVRQPEFVICDVDFLKTLPKEEITYGLAEVIKQAAIGDANLFDFIESHVDEILSLDKKIMERLIHDSMAVKLSIVELDEKETGERMKLNFGHTIGHAIEKTLGKPHGEAVAIGIVAESKISIAKGLMKKEDSERLQKVLESIGLLVDVQMNKEKIIDAIRKDKKRRGQIIKMPVLEGIGKSRIVEIGLKELEGAVNDLC